MTIYSSKTVTAASFKRHASPVTSPKPSKRAKQPDVVRKGIAKKVTRNRIASDTDSSDDASSSSGEQSSSSADSLQEELRSKAAKAKQTSRPRPERSHSRKASAASSIRRPETTSAPRPSTAKLTSRPGTTSATTVKSKVATQALPRAGPSGAARKSAPSHVAAGPARKDRDVLANWDAPKKRRERERVSEATPKDSTEPKFRTLGVQGRYQKYSRQNEKAPDFNALTVVDPKTGKTVPPKAPASAPAQSVPATAGELPSAYHRRTPPPQERQRSLTPPSLNRATATSRDLAVHSVGKPAKPICKAWLTCGCTKSAEECQFVHPIRKNHVNQYIDRKQVTCYFWFLHNGSCARGSYCAFAHSDTGIYSAPPNSGLGHFTVTLPPVDAPPSQRTSPPPPATARQASSAANSEKSGPHPPWQPACRDWLEGHCPNSAESCAWAHVLPTEHFKGDISNVPKRLVLCYYQLKRDSCSKGALCPFSHVDTGIQAGPPAKGVSGRTNILPAGPPKDSRNNSSVRVVEAIPEKLHPSGLTCFFWRTRGKCSKPDSECEFAHHDTSVWALPPPSHDVQNDASETVNANTIPVAAHRGMISTTFDSVPDASEPMELVRSPVQLDAAPMPPPVREETFRRPSISISAGTLSIALNISFSGDQKPTQLQVKLELSELPIFGKLAGADPQLNVDRAVLASDFRSFIWDGNFRDSESTMGGIAVSDVGLGQSLVNLCKQHTIGLIATQAGRKPTMLIYPPSDDVWKFLDTGMRLNDCALHFRLFSEMPGMEDISLMTPLQTERPSQRPHPVVMTGEELLKLDSKRMNPVPVKGAPVGRAVFIMFPPTHHVELEYYAKFFGAQKYRVYHAGKAGAWQYFRQLHDKKVVVVHPDVPLWQVPGIKEVIWAGTTFFSIGLNRLESIEDQSFSCERLFPFATAALITDDVFVYHPEKAAEILNGFNKFAKGKQEYKIVTRPGVKEFLLRLAENSFTERGRKDDRWFIVYDLMCRICPPEDEDPYDPPNPRPDAGLVSLSPELMPNYNAMWEKDEVAATAFMVEWFAGWTMENVGKLRKLYVLHEPRGGFSNVLDGSRWVPNEDPHGWAKKYQHIWFKKPQDVFASKAS